jgi:hypothetical protein
MAGRRSADRVGPHHLVVLVINDVAVPDEETRAVEFRLDAGDLVGIGDDRVPATSPSPALLDVNGTLAVCGRLIRFSSERRSASSYWVSEGTAGAAIRAADIVCSSILDAFDLLLLDDRAVIATIR